MGICINVEHTFTCVIYVCMEDRLELSQVSCLSSSVGRASHLECVRHGFESHPSAA